jgi:hypothetical protein
MCGTTMKKIFSLFTDDNIACRDFRSVICPYSGPKMSKYFMYSRHYINQEFK